MDLMEGNLATVKLAHLVQGTSLDLVQHWETYMMIFYIFNRWEKETIDIYTILTLDWEHHHWSADSAHLVLKKTMFLGRFGSIVQNKCKQFIHVRVCFLCLEPGFDYRKWIIYSYRAILYRKVRRDVPPVCPTENGGCSRHYFPKKWSFVTFLQTIFPETRGQFLEEGVLGTHLPT